MKDDIPLVYWTFRTAWTVVHLLVILVLALLLFSWAFTDNNAERLIGSSTDALLDLQRRVASAVPYPWDS